MIANHIPTAPFVAAVIVLLAVLVAVTLSALVNWDRLAAWALAASIVAGRYRRNPGQPLLYRGRHRMARLTARMTRLLVQARSTQFLIALPSRYHRPQGREQSVVDSVPVPFPRVR